MLGWFALPEDAPSGQSHVLMAALCRDLAGTGLKLAGAMQINGERAPDRDCDIDLSVIGDERHPIRISQSLGPGASGCRLDPDALEMAAARTEAWLEGADLVILPKFGPQEALGRGFRSVIARALTDEIPVLLHVPAAQRGAFLAFAEGMALEIDPGGLKEWCLAQVAGRA